MASMIITTHNPATRKGTPNRRSGFTLVEVMIAMSLSLIILAGVMTTYLFIMRAGFSTMSYADMENQSRIGLELFARDARMAKTITWNSANSITLVIPTSAADLSYLYQYNATAATFTRTCTTTGAATETLISGITPSSFVLKGYKITTNPLTHYPYEVDLTHLDIASVDTKQLQLTLGLGRTVSTTAGTSSNVISARFILRNKHVTS
jgi:prepilin-type N-terminal cleavage/methylation domain-containing protein